jgi:hypothetical protein
MFQLLVKYVGWTPGQDWLPLERVFEHTDASLAQHYRNGSLLNVQGLSGLPAIFASETGGKGSQHARIGQINSANVQGSQVLIQYSLDPNLEPIPNARLEKLALHLGIDEFEFRRTHWSLKAADLFRVLLSAQLRPVLAPKVFNLHGLEDLDPKLVSVMMPFDARFTEVFKTIRDTVSGIGLDCKRADDIWNHDVLVQDIVALIGRSRIVICDCTSRNANVFYEAGIAHALGRDVILITQSDGDIPFDLRHLRYAKYLDNAEGRAALARRLHERIQTIISAGA